MKRNDISAMMDIRFNKIEESLARLAAKGVIVGDLEFEIMNLKIEKSMLLKKEEK